MLDLIDKTRRIGEDASAVLSEMFNIVDKTAERRTEQVLAAFRRHAVSEAMLGGTTGYGYNDHGRETLEKIYADIFCTEAALVRIQFVNGTHAIASALYAACAPNSTLVSAIGAPYDTLLGVIGINNAAHGSLANYGVNYRHVEPLRDGSPDRDGIVEAARTADTVFIQRSRGYSGRNSLSADDVSVLYDAIKAANPNCVVVIDNCYGEFVDDTEPRGDLICGSLIKNPGGGIAPCGGYVCGRADLVERAAERLTVPGIGSEVGATLNQNRSLYQGLFLAPHTTAQAVKTALFAAKCLESLGYATAPRSDERRHDIIQSIDFGAPEPLLAFCAGIQTGSPIDSFATPVPWHMPGYDCDVVMAAGAFIQGASVELSCDAPMRQPFRAYLQGGLTFESGKLGVMFALERLL